MEINTKKFKKGDIFIVIGSDLDDLVNRINEYQRLYCVEFVSGIIPHTITSKLSGTPIIEYIGTMKYTKNYGE